MYVELVSVNHMTAGYAEQTCYNSVMKT